uniref:WGS project CBMI000000000 data, contig CS3069_c003674 n=1 Tax=Fusarium clavum TaxID=2594811 RepID=A0A090N5Y4_9HYPO|nr:unnamed protein product [Fusarium clavum]
MLGGGGSLHNVEILIRYRKHKNRFSTNSAETRYPSTDYTREDFNVSTPRSSYDVRVLLTVLY